MMDLDRTAQRSLASGDRQAKAGKLGQTPQSMRIR
jgi:hypothetical protein